MSGLESLLEQTHAKAELQLCCWGHGGCCPSRGHSEGSWPRGAGGKGQLWDGDPLARVYLQLWDAAVDEMGTVSCVGNAVQGKKKKATRKAVAYLWAGDAWDREGGTGGLVGYFLVRV